MHFIFDKKVSCIVLLIFCTAQYAMDDNSTREIIDAMLENSRLGTIIYIKNEPDDFQDLREGETAENENELFNVEDPE